MKTDYIEFKKKRELGDILTDTFAFLRSQFKPFLTTFFKIVGPFLLVMMICLGLYMYYIGDIATSLTTNSLGGTPTNIATTFLILLLYISSMVVVYTMSQSTALHYIKSYTNGKGETDFNTIKSEVYSSFWSFIGLGLLIGLLVTIGLMFCIIPGVYLWVSLSLAFSILVFDKKGVSESFGYSFTLIKDEWFITFATLFVIGIIVMVATYAFAIPGVIYSYAKMGIFSGEVDPENIMSVYQDPVLLLLSMISTLAQFILNLISVIAGAFIYFNLNEKKNFTGTYERIQNLGQTPKN